MLASRILPQGACCAAVPRRRQTDAYLEQLTDVVPETDTTTQTDAFLERPPTPTFVPVKAGDDAATQIETGGRGYPNAGPLERVSRHRLPPPPPLPLGLRLQ